MKNYSNFKTYFIMLRDSFKERGMSDIDIHDITTKNEFYKKIGLTDEDKIKQMEHKKTVEMNDRVGLGLSLIEQYGSVYEIEDDVMRYIALNKSPPKDIIKKLKLPFKSIFIETEITKEDFDDIDVDKISGVLITETAVLSRTEEQFSKKDLNYKNLGRMFVLYYFCEDKQRLWIDEFKVDVDGIKDLPIYYSDKKSAMFLKNFLMNFILFINDPEIELVHHRRSEKNIERRIRKGKIPLPDSRKVRLIGKLKKYVDGIRSNLQKGKFNFRFWVSGHYRTLRSEKYKKMRDKVIRIEPYMKGEGMLLKRTYELKFEENDERKEDEITLDNIKVAS